MVNIIETLPFFNDESDSRSAVFSPDRLYRYTLWRQWGDEERYVQFIGLNPSTADEVTNDNTVRKCIKYAKQWGYQSMCMTNIFAYRATDPKNMKAQVDPVGPENNRYLKEVAAGADKIICAWGMTHGGWMQRSNAVLFMLDDVDLYALSENKEGQVIPEHPLYLPSDRVPKLYRPARA